MPPPRATRTGRQRAAVELWGRCPDPGRVNRQSSSRWTCDPGSSDSRLTQRRKGLETLDMVCRQACFHL